VTSLPLGGWTYGTPFSILEQPAAPGPRPSAHIQAASEDYFAALGIPLAAGREFSARDDGAAPLVAIVNDTFVKKHLPGLSPIGSHVVMDQQTGPSSWEIVGVIQSVKTNGLAEKALDVPEIYVPYRQAPMSGLYLAVRSASVGAATLTPSVLEALRSVDPELPAGDVSTMEERVGRSVRTPRFRTGLIGAFAALAAVMACIGVYGVRSRAVAARRREMGIRLAMGARSADLSSLVVGEGMKLVAVGLAIGLAGSVAVTRMFQQWLFATRIVDVPAILIAVLTLGGAALAASWLPARRAARVDPLIVLRDE
jgi:putative ABC transport system permease protein